MKQITAGQLQQMIAEGNRPPVLDVRETGEFASGHIAGSLNIPLGLLPVRMQELDKNREWHVICLSGGRSAMACEFLNSHGFRTVNVTGGMSAWPGEVEY